MLLDLAIDNGNKVVDAVPRYSSLDHAANWSSLLSAVSRFVNFTKAIGQARRAADALQGGDWLLRDLFGKEAPASPRSVTPGLLTWWDTHNPTLNSDDPIICSNFATFEYLLAGSAGAYGLHHCDGRAASYLLSSCLAARVRNDRRRASRLPTRGADGPPSSARASAIESADA